MVPFTLEGKALKIDQKFLISYIDTGSLYLHICGSLRILPSASSDTYSSSNKANE
jgi:hypothetical protein